MPRDLPNMDTSTGVQPYEKTPTPGEVKPIHIFSGPRPKTDGTVVANLCTVLERQGGVLPPIAVRKEGPDRYRLIYGLHRLEASERCFGKQRAIPALIYPSGTPDAQIEMLLERQVDGIVMAAATATPPRRATAICCDGSPSPAKGWF